MAPVSPPPRRRHGATTARRLPAADGILERHRPVWGFVLKFLGVILLSYLLSLTPLAQRCQAVYLEATAGWAFAGLKAVGVECERLTVTIWSTKASVTVGPQCSAAELFSFLGAAMLAFPASWKWRCGGLLAGIGLLGMLNVVRVGSLFVVGVHAPAQFAWAHESGWPALLILATLGIVGIWIERSRPEMSTAHATAS